MLYGTSRKPQHILQAWPGERERHAGFVGLVLHHAGERNRHKLRKVRDDADGPVVRFGVGPHGLRANRAHDFGERLHAWVGVVFVGDQRIGRAAK